jgi:ribosomal protein S18 acetylase RimI-like enzyme
MPAFIRQARSAEHRKLRDIERSAAKRFTALGLTKIANAEPTGVDFIDAITRAGVVFVATLDAAPGSPPVGFALVGFLDQAAHIHELSVAEEHGRQGIGRQLVGAACDFGRDNGQPAITLSTFRDIPWNGPFYAKLGFRFVQPNEWTPAMFLLHDREIQVGLPVDRRGFMRKDLT